MTGLTMRPASDADRCFVEQVYFDTQRWLIEKLFGWRGDETERARFFSHYRQSNSHIISCSGTDIGWMTVVRTAETIDIHSIYLTPQWQRRGIGTALISQLLDEAKATHKSVTLSTAQENPALRLYKRLGFRPLREDHVKVYLVYVS